MKTPGKDFKKRCARLLYIFLLLFNLSNCCNLNWWKYTECPRIWRGYFVIVKYQFMNINTGLIGYGMGGRIFHAPLIDHVDGLRLHSIRETKPERIAHALNRYPDVKIVDDAKSIFTDPEVELVVLAVPNEFHHPLAIEALNHDKHVVVEKPFTVTSKQAEELSVLAAKKNKILTVYQNRRFDSDFMTVRKVIESGKLGRLVEYEAHYDRFRNTIRPSTWKEEGTPGTGLLYDLGSHLIDQALQLFGSPREVTGFLASQRDNSRITDSFQVILHYEKVKVTLKSGMLVKAPLPKYIVLGTQGTFVKYGQDVQEATLNAGEKSLSDSDWGKEPADIWGTLHYESDGETCEEKVESIPGNYAAFNENVRDAILGKQLLYVTSDQAKQTIRVIELMEQSHREKRTVDFG